MFNTKTLTAWAAAVIAVITLASCNLLSGDKSETRYAAVKLVDSDRWSIVDVNSGEIIHRDEFKNQPSAIVGDKFCVQNDEGLYDYFSVDNVTKPINKESYVSASAFSENGIAVATPKGKAINVINDKCETIATLNSSIKIASNFVNGYAIIVTTDNKFGFINEKGEIVVKPTYDSCYSFFSEDGIAIMAQYTGGLDAPATNLVAVDTSGKVLFSTKGYTGCSQFVNGYLIAADSSDNAFVLDKTGKRVCTIGAWNYSSMLQYLGVYDNMVVFQQEDSYGLKDLNGETVIRAKYDRLLPYNALFDKKGKHQDLYLAEKDDKWGVINNKDEVIISFREGEIIPINSDNLLAGKSPSFSIIDLDGKDVCRENFSDVGVTTNARVSFAMSDVSGDASRAIEAEKSGVDYDTLADTTEAAVVDTDMVMDTMMVVDTPTTYSEY